MIRFPVERCRRSERQISLIQEGEEMRRDHINFKMACQELDERHRKEKAGLAEQWIKTPEIW